MNRRAFLGVATATTAYASLAAEMAASIAAGDSGPLATVQTSHTADWITASVLDRAATRRLVRWVEHEPGAVARVNAAGVLAKVPGRLYDDVVTDALERDLGGAPVARHRRGRAGAGPCLVDSLEVRGGAADGPRCSRDRDWPWNDVSGGGARLSREAVAAADAGARWCSAAMLRDLIPAAGR